MPGKRGPYLTRKRADEIVVRLRAKVRKQFPLGTRVRLSKRALDRSLRLQRGHGPVGTVTGYSAGVSPSVLWDGRKTAAGYSPDFLSKVHHVGPR